MVLGTVTLAGCATIVAVTDRMPPPAALAAGEGLVIGSIVMTTPNEIATPDQKEMIDALKQRKLKATILRYVMRISQDEQSEFALRDYVGEKFVVSFDVDAEHRVVIRAPAGKYSVLELSDIHPGLFGDNQPGCKMRDLATFEVHPGKTTYIGKLVVRAGFKSEKMLYMAKVSEHSGVTVLGVSERWLDMSLSATDAKQDTLRDLTLDPTRAPAEIETELMTVGIGDWHYDTPEIPKPPK
jgi:hypothetical protein